MSYKVTFPTRWADFDPNNHLRHSAYNDYAAEARGRYFKEFGLTLTQFKKQNIGPILFSENTRFFKEVEVGEDITVELYVKGLSEKGERFKFDHKIYKEDGSLAAKIEIHGAWLDLEKRKLTAPPDEIFEILNKLDRTENFEIIPVSITK